MPIPTHHLFEIVLIAILVIVVRVDFRRKRRLQVENLRLQSERKVVVEFMHELALALEENPTKDQLMKRILRAASESTGAMSACLYELDEKGRLRAAAMEGLFPPQSGTARLTKESIGTRSRFIENILQRETIGLGEGLIGEVAMAERGELIEDASRDPRIIQHRDASLSVSSMLVIPLRFNRRCFGVLALANPVHGGAFSPTDFELIQWLAEQASLALHNADFLNLHLEKREMDLDFSLASSIQKMLLPSQAPVIASLDVGFKYIPAQRIGGDLYDFIPLTDGRLGVVIADVSGKGLPASILMTSCRSSLRQIAPRHDSPAAVLRELNESLIGDVQPGMFITMVYVVLDARAGRLQYARAGHELPLLLKAPSMEQRGRDQFEFLEGDGLPLGMVSGELFDRYVEERSCAFDEGDVLVLYTDGITEAPNAEDKEYSGARLADVLTRRGRQTADELISEVLADLSVFSEGRAQRDDYTIVTIRRL